MGLWGHAAWDNDIAADWFHAFFDGIRLDERIAEAFIDRNDLPVIRAACFILSTLGRRYVWPGDLTRLANLLEEGINLLSRIAKPTPEDMTDNDFLEYWGDDPAFNKAVRTQIKELRKRRAEIRT